MKANASFASVSDPDGNGGLLQEITQRIPDRKPLGATRSPHEREIPMQVTYESASELAGALRRAAAAHDGHEQEIGHADPDWPNWYAQYMVDERAAQAAQRAGA